MHTKKPFIQTYPETTEKQVGFPPFLVWKQH